MPYETTRQFASSEDHCAEVDGSWRVPMASANVLHSRERTGTSAVRQSRYFQVSFPAASFIVADQLDDTSGLQQYRAGYQLTSSVLSSTVSDPDE